MNFYQARTSDIHFILDKVLQAPLQLQGLQNYAEIESDLIQQVLEESGKFVSEIVAPLNRVGDEVLSLIHI